VTSWTWFGLLGLTVFVYFADRAGRKLDRIIKLLEIAVDQQAEANSNLRNIDHNSDVIRERTPRR
jgi:hypothetical protein